MLRLGRQIAIASLMLAVGGSAAWAGTVIVSTPEPASIVLLGAGIAGVLAVRRRRRRK